MRPEVASALLTALGILGTWFAAWLTRRGKREDYKIQIGNQALLELKALADGRKEEIERLRQQNADQEARHERAAAAWDARWNRQMERCRKITDAATAEITALMRRTLSPQTRRQADATLRDIEDHGYTDHADQSPADSDAASAE